jgi:hypothetical protein
MAVDGICESSNWKWIAAQDKALQTKYQATEIVKTVTDAKCTLYQREETIHIMYSHNNITYSDTKVCALNYALTLSGKSGKIKQGTLTMDCA